MKDIAGAGGVKWNLTHLSPPLPHPDQVKIDMNTGGASIQGPATKGQVEQLELWLQRWQDWHDELSELQQVLNAEKDPERRASLEGEINECRKVLDAIEKLVGKLEG